MLVTFIMRTVMIIGGRYGNWRSGEG